MDKNIFLNKIKKNKFILNGWLSIPNSFTAEAMSKLGWDSLTIDLQHGQSDYLSSIPMVQVITNNNIFPLARVPWNEPGIIMKMLDLGILGIIAPMINNKKECEDFISYCYYPPLGQRSFGPMRAQLHYGLEYSDKANKNVITFAMIETEEAVNNIDEILSVPELKGIYIGPADMSTAYGLPPKFDVKDDPVFSNIKNIVKKAREKGKIAGIHNGTTLYAKMMVDLGFEFITVSSDYRSMTSHSQNIVDEMRNNKEKDTSSSNY